MKYRLPNINAKYFNFDCTVNNRIKYKINYYDCCNCKENFQECWEKTIKRKLHHDCIMRNAIKFIHQNKEHICDLCQNVYTDIITSEDGKIELYCPSCNSTKEIDITVIKEKINEKFEKVDENELNKYIYESMNDKIKKTSSNIKTCVLCNNEFQSKDEKEIICTDCQNKI